MGFRLFVYKLPIQLPPTKAPMLISVLTNDLLFPVLDPRHLGNLCLVNRELAKRIDRDTRDKSVAAALAKYRKMVILSEDTFRIHSSLGKTVIDLTLPNDKQPFLHSKNAVLSMRFEGRLYHGRTTYRRCSLNGKLTNLSPHVFHAQSSFMLNSKSVAIVGVVIGESLIQIRVIVEDEDDVSRVFTLHFSK